MMFRSGITFDYELSEVKGQEANDLLRSALQSSTPQMLCRFGETELSTVINYLTIKDHSQSIFSKLKSSLKDKAQSPFWHRRVKRKMQTNAGFFPNNSKNLERFAELMLADMPSMDVLGSWLYYEEAVKELFPKTIRIPLRDISSPFLYSSPWSSALEGKKVLVVHPFESEIRSQYQKREKLFQDSSVLPEFDLTVIKAVQSIAGTKVPFHDWFEALEYMKDQVSSADFDIAILGCGAYGFPLAAHVKRLGKKAVHMGGSTQLLFGIQGRRWDANQCNGMYNEHWIRPSGSSTLKDQKKVENACYW